MKEIEADKANHGQSDSLNLFDIGKRAVRSAYRLGILISTGTDFEDEANKDWSPLLNELLVLQRNTNNTHASEMPAIQKRSLIWV